MTWVDWSPISEQMFKPEDLFDLNQTEHRAIFENCTYAWGAISQIGPYLKFRLVPAILGEVMGKPYLTEDVFLGEGSVVEPGAHIAGPAWIGKNCVIRHGAYLRGNVIVGDNSVLGNSCEFKNCLLFNDVQVPHFSYVGDSILGHRAHLGAGVICSNVRLDHQEVMVRYDGKSHETGLKKFGALIGDGCEVGCNSVLNPGTVLGRKAMIMPGTIHVGVLPPGGIGRNR
jgi:NDP-sugar pyrophosphorylase family protein